MEKNLLHHMYILVGASGVGKTTMAEVLQKEFGYRRCITSTTRQPRKDELNGIHYYFLSEKEFAQKAMFEYAEFGGHRYGITMDELQRGDFVILEPQGVDFYRNNYPGPLTIVKLERKGIEIDEERRSRDRNAGFDRVEADVLVCGETIQEMSENLVNSLRFHERSLKFQMNNACNKHSHLIAEAAPLNTLAFCR